MFENLVYPNTYRQDYLRRHFYSESQHYPTLARQGGRHTSPSLPDSTKINWFIDTVCDITPSNMTPASALRPRRPSSGSRKDPHHAHRISSSDGLATYVSTIPSTQVAHVRDDTHTYVSYRQPASSTRHHLDLSNCVKSLPRHLIRASGNHILDANNYRSSSAASSMTSPCKAQSLLSPVSPAVNPLLSLRLGNGPESGTDGTPPTLKAMSLTDNTLALFDQASLQYVIAKPSWDGTSAGSTLGVGGTSDISGLDRFGFGLGWMGVGGYSATLGGSIGPRLVLVGAGRKAH